MLFSWEVPKKNFDTIERAKVFAEALTARGRRSSTDQIRYGEYSVEWGQRAGEALFATRTAGPIGVLAGNDEIAFGLLQAAKDMAVGVPTDLRIVGFDDTLTRPRSWRWRLLGTVRRAAMAGARRRRRCGCSRSACRSLS